MKITIKKLKQIIEEEKHHMLMEAESDMTHALINTVENEMKQEIIDNADRLAHFMVLGVSQKGRPAAYTLLDTLMAKATEKAG